MHKGLLFDLDGVIVDTAKYHYIAWKEIAQELGIPFTWQDNERLKGVSRDRSFEIILELGGIEMPAETKMVYCKKKNDNYLALIDEMSINEILPGVGEFMADSRRLGYKIALGSASKNSRNILSRLQLTDLFDAIIDGTMVTIAKPDPEVFTKGAQALGLCNWQCIVFEDAVAGIEAAHIAGMKAVGIGVKEILPEADFNMPGFMGVSITHIEEKLRCLAIK